MKTDQNIEENRICSNCIGEPFLSQLVENNGKRRKCAYCGVIGKTTSVVELTDKTQTVLEGFYQRTPEDPDNYQYALMHDKESSYDWIRDGDPITDVIRDLANISEKAAQDVQSILADRFFSRSSDEIGEETEYSIDSQYEYIGVGSEAWEEKWKDFENSLKMESRYFNQLGKDYLDKVFEGIHNLKTINGNPIVEVGPGKNLESAYRARVFLSDEELRKALMDIVGELGPPSSRVAKAGRMNATGISVFYGATDSRTALAEVRPPVGSNVAVAQFKFIRELKLLNVMGLENFTVNGSLYDPEHAALLSRVQFLNQLSAKMTVPVMPGSEDTDYLVTQAIADYLSLNSDINIDGIIFPSIQTDSGSNIVLFHKSSKVQSRDMPLGTEVSVQLWEYAEERPFPWFVINEETPKLPPESSSFVENDKDARIAALAIEDSEIKIHEIKAVEFATDSNDVSVRRYEKNKFEEVTKNIFGEHKKQI